MALNEQKGDQTYISVRGDFAEAPFARLFYRLCQERRSGLFDVRDKPPEDGGKIMKRVILADGELFAVKGGSRRETLTEILLEQKKISKEKYDELYRLANNDFDEMEKQVMAGGVVPAAELQGLLTAQVELKLKMLFTLIRGQYEFKPQARDALVAGNLLLPIGVKKVFLDGVREHYPAARVKKEFPGIEKKGMSPAKDWKDQILTLGLPPKVQRWLRSFPESFTWSAMIKSSPESEEVTAALLLALFFAGLITLPEGEAAFPIGKAYQTEREAAKAEEKKAAEKTPGPAKAAASATPPPKPAEPKLPVEEMLDQEMSDKELLKQIDRLLDTAASHKNNYFEILGVQENTPPAKTKQIYFKFAKKFHPDARPDLFKGEVKEKVEELFTKISEAYNVISDPETRSNFIKEKKSSVSKADMDKASRAIEAEMEFQKAEILMKRNSWAPAEDLLERAVQLQPDEPEYQMYLTWARYKGKGSAEAPRARDAIKKVLASSPNNADANYFLGIIAKSEGFPDEAEKYLLKAQELKPHDVDIKREVQLLFRRKEKGAATEKKGGFFGKKK